MPTHVMVDGFLSLGGTDISAHLTQVSIEPTSDTPEDTSFGSGGWRTFAPNGLKTWVASLDYNQDYAAGALDATLWPLFGTRTPLVFRPASAAVSVENPQFTGDVIVNGYPPITGSVGELATGTITLQGRGELARATS